MSILFSDNSSFNQDIGSWDVSNVTKIKFMFNNASSFNQDIGSWDVSNSLDMTAMFQFANSFNQDLTQWCVTSIPNEPRNFSSPGCPLTPANKPVWGTCP
jgi:surface protein